MFQDAISEELTVAADRIPPMAIMQALVATLGYAENPAPGDTLFQRVAPAILGTDSPLRITDDKATQVQALEALKLAERYLAAHGIAVNSKA